MVTKAQSVYTPVQWIYITLRQLWGRRSYRSNLAHVCHQVVPGKTIRRVVVGLSYHGNHSSCNPCDSMILCEQRIHRLSLMVFLWYSCGLWACVHQQKSAQWSAYTLWAENSLTFVDGNLVVCWWYAHVIYGHVQEKLVACMYVHQQKSIVFTQWCAYTLWAENLLRMVFLWCVHVIYGHVQEKLVACMYVCFGEEGATEVTWLMSATK